MSESARFATSSSYAGRATMPLNARQSGNNGYQADHLQGQEAPAIHHMTSKYFKQAVPANRDACSRPCTHLSGLAKPPACHNHTGHQLFSLLCTCNMMPAKKLVADQSGLWEQLALYPTGLQHWHMACIMHMTLGGRSQAVAWKF